MASWGLSLLTPDDGAQIEPPGIITYAHLNSDLVPLIRVLKVLNPDLLFHHGHRQEALALVRACAAADFTPGAIALDCGITLASFRDQLGSLAPNIIGSVAWSESLQNFAHDRFTSASDFARNYFDEFSERASSLAAGAAACGVLFEKALQEAKTSDPTQVQGALKNLHTEVFFGGVRFDAGQNTASRLISLQFREMGHELQEVLLWPQDVSLHNTPRWPFPGWQFSP
jgi:ABC-type branched-subunit amino acid transport system substrate-binding protein